MKKAFSSIIRAFVISVMTVGICNTLLATVYFNNKNATFAIKASPSRFKTRKAVNVIGWTQQSIVRDAGNTASNTWTEAYTNGSVVSVDGGTVVPPLALTYANSNVLGGIGSLIRTTSNAMLFGDRVTSNALQGPAMPLRTMSNALLFGDRIVSAGLLYSNNIQNNLPAKTLVYPHLVLRNNTHIRHFIRLSNGFTLDNSVTTTIIAYLDTAMTLSGSIDMRGQILRLKSDVCFDGAVTITSGGAIQGYGKTILLNGNLSFSPTTTRVLHISSDTIIDGKGGTLSIGDYAQIFVDLNATLTLKNLTVVGSKKSGGYAPFIKLAGPSSQLALDNVQIPLAADWRLRQGRLFIHNDVRFTGTNALIYQSPNVSYITPGASCIFDIGTTFSFCPATANQNLFYLQNATSRLHLNGCSLNCTYTGIRLINGLLVVDNRVQVNTVASVDISSSPATIVGSAVVPYATAGGGTVNWLPNGRYIIVSPATGNGLQLYTFNGSSTPTAVGSSIRGNGGGLNYSIDGSADGRYFVAGFPTGQFLQVYGCDANSTPFAVGRPFSSNTSQAVTFSPDGRYIAASVSGATLAIYSFNGVYTPSLIGSVNTGGGQAYSCSWSPDGKRIACGQQSGTAINVYTFTGSGNPTFLTSVSLASTGTYCAWSPDGRYLLCVYGSTTAQVYSFNGSTLTAVGSTFSGGIYTGKQPWSPDGKYLALLVGSSITIYSFNGVNTPVSVGSFGSSTVVGHCWSPDGNHIALLWYTTTMNLAVYKINYIKAAGTQALSNSVVFGNSASGAGANLNVQVLSSARVELNGKMKDDSA